MVDGLEKEYAGKVEFRRYNVETDPKGIEVANAFGVTAVPTFAFVNSDGIVAGTMVGKLTAEQMREQLDKLR